MNFHLKINQEIDKRLWHEFVAKHPEGNIFQTPEMYDFLSSVKKYNPITIVCMDKDHKMKGILSGVTQKEHQGILGKLSSRTVVWGGPLINYETERKRVGDVLIKTLIKLVKKNSIYIEFRNLFSLFEYKNEFIENGFRFNEHQNYIVHTISRDMVEKGLSSNRKRQIKKSSVTGVEIVEAENLSQIKDFYNILTNLYQKKIKKPLPDWSFFKNFFTEKKELGIYLLIKHNEKIIGGMMCPIYKNKFIYEWYICGLDKEYPKQYPSVMATWAAIDYALNNGIKSFDFMGAGKPGDYYGVQEFKARFGGKLVNYGRFIKVNNKFLYVLGKIGLSLSATIKRK